MLVSLCLLLMSIEAYLTYGKIFDANVNGSKDLSRYKWGTRAYSSNETGEDKEKSSLFFATKENLNHD